jgi:hypothetical protein
MKIAKASEADLNMAMDLAGALECLSHRWVPSFPQGCGDTDPDADDDFDVDDDQHCGRALRHLLDIAKRGSMGRVVWGMVTLVDPSNKIIDPAADVLEVHPDLKRRVEAPESLRSALQVLHSVCVAMDLVNQMERPTEDQYQSAMAQASAALKAIEPGRKPEAAVGDLVKQALAAADYFGYVVTVEQLPLQPFAMGHYQSVFTIQPKRVLEPINPQTERSAE